MDFVDLSPAHPTYRPGDYLKPGEDDVRGLKRRLALRLGDAPNLGDDEGEVDGVDMNNTGIDEWEVADVLAQWWRPNYESFMVRRPRLPCRCW